MSKPLLIYIAGPYRAATPHGVDMNILRAREVAVRVWELGHYALCPHLNTGQFERLTDLPDSCWLEGDLVMLARCDAIVPVAGWQKSSGTVAEMEMSRKQGLWIFGSVRDIPEVKR